MEAPPAASPSPSSAEEAAPPAVPRMSVLADNAWTYMQHIVAGTSAGFTAELLLFCVEIRNYPTVFKTEGADPRHCVRWRNTSLNLKELGRQFGSIASNKAPVAGLVMASYDLFKREISVRLNAFNKRRTDEGVTRSRLELLVCQPLSVCFIAGFSAQMLEAFLMNPIFVIRSAHVRGHFDHVAEPVRSPPSVWQATRDLFREGGPRAFWRGYWATVASGAPFISCYYAFAEMFGQMIAHRAGYASPLDLPLHLSALAGGCGAGLAVAITTPLEILRQRGLTEWHHWNQTKEVLLSQGFVQAVKSVKSRCRQELQDKLFRVAPRSAVKKATYGFFKQAIIRGIKAGARASIRR